MKAFALTFIVFLFISLHSLCAQSNDHNKNNGKHLGYEKHKTLNNDTTGGSGSFNELSGTPGPATTSGTGGLGTIEQPGYNTSRDIYNIERRDSIREAKNRIKSDSIRTVKDKNSNNNK